jgi:hypothetical protein
VDQPEGLLGARKRLSVVLGLAQDCAQLQPQLTLKFESSVALSQIFGLHEARLFKHLERLLEVVGALIKHGELLEAHRHVVARDELYRLVARARLQIDDFQHALCLLEKHKSLFVLVTLSEVVGCVG